jgi:hypothetical protein
MPRLFGRSYGRRGVFAARFVAIGALCLSAATLFSVTTTLPVSAASGMTSAAQGTGLQLVLFGTKITGGDASACVNETGSTATTANKNGDGTASLCNEEPGTYAASEGEGTLLTSQGVELDAKASEQTAGQTDGSTSSKCAQGGTTPSGTPVLLSLGLSCVDAYAAVGSSGDPSASSMGEVANVTIGLNSVLAPLLGASPSSGSGDSCNNEGSVGALVNSVCTALSNVSGSSPQPASSLFAGIKQALQNLYDVVTKNLDPTVTIDVGQAKSAVTTSSGALDASAQGSTLDISVLPGVGCAAPPGDSTQPTLAQCTADSLSSTPQYAAPLIEVVLAPAQSSVSDQGGTWSSTGQGSLATIDINIPGDQHTISLSPDVDQTILSGTPLQTTIDLGSAQTNHSASGASSGAQGADINLLESSTFPGGSNTAGAVSADLGSTTTTAGSGPVATAAPLPPVPATASVSSPTAVHTGEWWSGSMPFIAGFGLFGMALLGVPRLRRWQRASSVVSKASR